MIGDTFQEKQFEIQGPSMPRPAENTRFMTWGQRGSVACVSQTPLSLLHHTYYWQVRGSLGKGMINGTGGVEGGGGQLV